MNNFWCEVYLDRLEANIKKIRCSTSKKIMVVIKGNAYGLGIEKISEFLDDKVDSFATAYLQEAQKVKSSKDILILTPEFKTEDFENMKDNYVHG